MLKRGGILIVLVILISVSVTGAFAINITLGGTVDITQILNMMNNKIINVGSPTINTDAATKGYVDSIALSGTPGIIDADTFDGINSPAFLTETEHNAIPDADTIPWNSRVPQSTSLFPVDTGTNVGQFTSITIGTDGLPVISYYDIGNTALKVAHCENTSCTSASTFTVDNAGSVGEYTSIAIGTDGFPIISYHDGGNGDLKVAHCENVSCTSGSPTITLISDSADDVGEYTSITIGTDGFPIISYRDITNTALKVAHCENTSCTSASTFTVDNAGSVGEYTSIAIGTDGLPVISYRDRTDNDLKVAHCTNTSCSSGSPTITAVDPIGGVGYNTSITIGADGFPIVSYDTQAPWDLRVAHCTNTSCSTFDTPTTVDSSTEIGLFSSITIGTDGLPIISYDHFSSAILNVVKCGNTSCSSGSPTITTVDSSVGVGLYTSITIGTDGLPVISYQDIVNGNLKVAKCTNPYCLNNWIRR